MTNEKKISNGRIGVFALAMLNVVAVVSLRGLPAEAEYGLSSVFYYIFAAVVFLVPVSLVAAELATGWSEKGGIFRWVGEAFGPRFALVAVFMLWIEVTVWFPTALTFGSVSLAFIGPDTTWDQALSENKFFILSIVLGIYWFATFVALRGTSAFAKLAKWGGLIGTIIPGIVLIVLGFSYMLFSGQPSQIEMTWGNLIPDFSNFNNIVLAASIFLFYAGMEMNAIHVSEVDNAARNYPIAIAIAAIGTVSVFVLGTLAIAFIIPQQDISLTQSLLIAYDKLFAWAGIGWASPVVAACLALGVLAGVVGWVAGPSSALLVVAKGGYLPRFWQHTNKNGMATHIMLAQAILVTLISTIFVVLPSVQAAYQILSQLTVVLYLIMYLMMFAAAIYLRYSQPNRPRPYKIPGGDLGMWLIAGLGFIGSLIAFLFSYIPPAQISVGSPEEFVGFLILLTVFFVSMPLVIYQIRKPHWKDESVTDFAPFTWEIEGIHPGIINTSDKVTHELNK
ncbi:amino acid transporter [Shewanella hanedai]|jgi:putative glutamate/gamma-aminobutyrate antiporter|uniref:Amino acid permease n=1 Tax=Shewanella hanedai TaxID=25 RepID=A0A553JJH8_SHEHA|nr:putative glutamine/gamma-aminobutyrate antiporter GadC [Shewanella hanedai]TRY12558.1 amino acid permease [Shewanella hanedai]GGI95298.1 amino acid transporter [Shewanella hanedai]